MKAILLSFLSILCGFGLQAQITITAATFPAAGDTLRYGQANNPAVSNLITPPGGNQIWDFSGLTTDITFETVYQPAGQGQFAAEFPQADLGVFTASGEQYFNVTDTRFELLGYSSNSLFGYSFSAVYNNNPPFAERQAPLDFFEINQESFGQLEGFAVAELPAGLVAVIQNMTGGNTPDSIRFRTAQNTLDVMDGWGTVTVPGPAPRPEYAVLRQKRTSYIEKRLDAKINPLGWLDVTDLAISNNLDGGAGYFGVDTVVAHYFLSNEAKEEIAVMTLNTDQSTVQSVRYKNNDVMVPVSVKAASNELAISVYPNPADKSVRFECAHLPPGRYSLRLFDGAGRVVWSNTNLLAGNRFINVELKDLKRGIYFYRLEDQTGRLVAANRLVVGQE